MRVIHVSDTHIGYSAYHRVDEHGLNQREQDVFDAFRQVVDAAIAEEVDAVVHSGDLFDSVRPTNRAVAFAMGEVKRLTEAGVPFVVISGNHETPKLRETGSVLRFLDFIPGVHAVYRGRGEVVRVGDLAVHCVPHAPTNEALQEELASVEPLDDARYNVLTLHAGVVGVGDFRTGEFNEQTIPASLLHRDMDYVALGHYHRHTQVTKNAFYAGSTERTSFKEAGERKGYVLLDLEAGERAFREVEARPMQVLPHVDCAGLAEVEIPATIRRRLKGVEPAGKLLRLKVTGLPRHVYATLDFGAIRRLTEGAVHAQLVYEVADEEGRVASEGARIGGLAGEFEAFLKQTPVNDLDKDRLRKEALEFLEAAQGVEG